MTVPSGIPNKPTEVANIPSCSADEAHGTQAAPLPTPPQAGVYSPLLLAGRSDTVPDREHVCFPGTQVRRPDPPLIPLLLPSDAPHQPEGRGHLPAPRVPALRGRGGPAGRTPAVLRPPLQPPLSRAPPPHELVQAKGTDAAPAATSPEFSVCLHRGPPPMANGGRVAAAAG